MLFTKPQPGADGTVLSAAYLQVLKLLLAASKAQPQWFRMLVEMYRHNYPPDSFDAAMQRILPDLADDLRYQFACFVARRYVGGGETEKMRDLYAHLLTIDRPQNAGSQKAEINSASGYAQLSMSTVRVSSATAR